MDVGACPSGVGVIPVWDCILLELLLLSSLLLCAAGLDGWGKSLSFCLSLLLSGSSFSSGVSGVLDCFFGSLVRLWVAIGSSVASSSSS